MNLLIAQLEFLKPNMFNINQLVVGVTTDGEMITKNDPFPNIDIPNQEILRQPPKNILDADKLYRKYGYDLLSFQDARSKSNFHRNNINMLVPFINEYTYDLIPVEPFFPLP